MKQVLFIRNMTVLFFLMSIFVGGCVSKHRFQVQVGVSKALSRQLQEEKQRHGDLKKEITALKAQFEKLQASFVEEKIRTLELLEKSKHRLSSLEKARELTQEVGRKIENIFKDEFGGVKEAYEDVFERADKKISKIQDSLEESNVDLNELRRKIEEKIEKLTAFLDELNGNGQ